MVRVLVVEDDPGIRDMLEFELYPRMGCEVVACASLEKAQQHLATGGFQIVHLDDNLTKPHIHEGSLILAPIALQMGCRVVGCSGEVIDEEGKSLWPEGVMVTRKPFPPGEFKVMIGKVVASLGS